MDKEQNKQNEQPDKSPQKNSVFNHAEINSCLCSANLIIFFGFMLAGFFGLYFLKRLNAQTLSTLTIILLPTLFFFGCLMMFGGSRLIGQIKKIGAYMTFITPGQPAAINEIALKTKKSELSVHKDFTMFFKNGYLYGRIDETKHEIILTAGKQ